MREVSRKNAGTSFRKRFESRHSGSKKNFPAKNSAPAANWKIELIGNAFYRGRGAYLVGRVIRDEVNAPLPLALCLRHDTDKGITLDAVLLGAGDLAILFSYTRAYFRVDAGRPYELVRYLRLLMPRKRLIDLYNSIGHPRHGKTEFYRNFVAHLQNVDRSIRHRRRNARHGDDCFHAAELRCRFQTDQRSI